MAADDLGMRKRLVTCSDYPKVTRREALAASVATAGVLALGSAAHSAPATADPNSTGRKRWLIVAAHPDDESKATPLIFAERKPDDEVVVLIMRLCGEGRLQDRNSWTREEAIATRTYEMQQAARFLKAELRWWLPPHPENANIAKTPETVAKMVGLLKEIKPDRIVTHWDEDSHPDHAGTAALIRAALAELAVPGGMPVYFWGQPGREQEQPRFIPTQYIDISDPTRLAQVLWSRFVHRCQTAPVTMQSYLKYFHAHGQKAGVPYAAGYVLEHA